MPVSWQNVYVFISSTFNCMHAERDYLVKQSSRGSRNGASGVSCA